MLQRNLNRTRNSWSGGDRCHSGGFLLRIMPPSWYQSPPASSMPVAGETIPRQNPAVIRKSGLEIKNRCMKDGVNGEKLASIPKSGLEIKNQCTKEGVNGEIPASIRKFGPEIKNRCTKQPIFSTLPQQIPQQIPQHAFHHALTTRLALDVCMGRARAGLTVAAKAGADAPGGGISLCFCRRGCAAPAQKAATLNDSRCSTRPTRLHANSFCRISSHRRWRRTVCASLQGAP